jgi:hypothetical protein
MTPKPLSDQDRRRIAGIRQAAGVRLVSLATAQQKWDADPRPPKHPIHAHFSKGVRPGDRHCTVAIDPHDVIWLCQLAQPAAGDKAPIVKDLLMGSTSVVSRPRHPDQVHLMACQVALLCDLAEGATNATSPVEKTGNVEETTLPGEQTGNNEETTLPVEKTGNNEKPPAGG